MASVLFQVTIHILNEAAKSTNKCIDLGKAPKAKKPFILSEIKQMSERLSDFGSCISSNSEDENDLTWNEKKKKRKAKHSPRDKSYFLKKINSENQSLVSPIHPTP